MAEKKHILVAEDESAVRNILRESLAQDYEVETANNGQEAVEAFFQTPFDAVLMDLHMPVLDGCQAMQQIRLLEGGKKVPIIVLTALDSDEWEKESLKAGATIFMTKPFKASDVLHCLQTVLQEPAVGAPAKNAKLGPATHHFKVRYQTPEGFLNCYLKNLQQSRSFLETDHPLPLGSSFNFEITPPRGEKPFNVIGIVKWVNLYSGQKGMGVQFSFENADDKKRIHKLVAELDKN